MTPRNRAPRRLLALSALVLVCVMSVKSFQPHPRSSGHKTIGPVATILVGAIQSTWVAHAYTLTERNSPSKTNSYSTKETNRFSIALEKAKPFHEGQILFRITVTNTTDDLLLLRSFRHRDVDARVVLKQGSSRVMQRFQEKDGSFPMVWDRFAMAVQPHSSTQELIDLKRFYDLGTGTYSVYVLEDDPSTKGLVQSNTIPLDIQ